MQVGKWLDNQGIDAKPCARASAAPALPAVPTQKAIEKLLAAVYAPWNDIDNGKHKPVKVCTPFLQPSTMYLLQNDSVTSPVSKGMFL